MVRVRAPHWEEVIVVDHDTTLLHDAERALRTGLLHIPHHFIVNALYETNKEELISFCNGSASLEYSQASIYLHS